MKFRKTKLNHHHKRDLTNLFYDTVQSQISDSLIFKVRPHFGEVSRTNFAPTVRNHISEDFGGNVIIEY